METPAKLTEQDLTSRIDDILSSNLYLEAVPYSFEDNAQQVSYQSRQDAAREIVEFLKKNNLFSEEPNIPLSKVKIIAVDFAREWQAGNIIIEKGVEKWFNENVK